MTLSVDETPLSEETTTIGIKQRPVIVCKDADNIEYDLEQPMYLATNTKGTYYLIVSTSSPLKGALLQNDRFTEFGVPANSMDLMNLGGKDASVEASGISLHAPNAIMETGGTWKIQFSEELIAKMTAQEGQVTTTLTATDKNGKQRMVTWNIVVSNATVATTEAIPYEIWTSKATLHGKVTGTLASTPKFQYRVKGAGSSWTTVDADLTESTFSKEITGLTPVQPMNIRQWMERRHQLLPVNLLQKRLSSRKMQVLRIGIRKTVRLFVLGKPEQILRFGIPKLGKYYS